MLGICSLDGVRKLTFREEKTGPDGEHIFHMFVRDKDDKAELWDGARSGVQAAVDVFNADEVK